MIFDRDFQRAADSGTEGLAGLDGPAAHSADNAAADRLVKRSLDKFPAVNEPAADDDAGMPTPIITFAMPMPR